MLVRPRRNQPIGWFSALAFFHPLKRAHRPPCAFAVAYPALAPHFNFKNALAAFHVVDDGDIAVFKERRFVGAQAGVSHDQHIIMEILRCPRLPIGRIARRLARRGVERFVLFG